MYTNKIAATINATKRGLSIPGKSVLMGPDLVREVRKTILSTLF